MEHTMIELRNIAKKRGLTGYSKLRKAELIVKLKLKLRMKTDFMPILERFLRPNIRFDESASSYLNSIFNKLVSRIGNIDFVESLGYLGEAALEAPKFTNTPIEGVKNVCTSNMIIYIASELVDLLNYSAIDKKRDRILVSDIERVIKNDHDLDIAFN
jgi:hypothetical protein